MQIVIDIPEEMYTHIKGGADGYSNYVHSAIRNGILYSSKFNKLAGMNNLIRLIKRKPRLAIADAEKDASMKELSLKEALKILEDMKVDIPVPKAAVTQHKRNRALDMAIEALKCSEIPNSSKCEWIPCSEWMPTDLSVCWITMSTNKLVYKAVYSEKYDGFFIGKTLHATSLVSAWMPCIVPEPYCKEDSDT